MDRYATLDEYVQAKQRIFHGNGHMVINADDPLVAAMARPERRVSRFSLNEPASGDFGLRRQPGATWMAHGEDCLMAASELRLGGTHNVANALAALAMGHALGLDRNAMLDALRAFPGLPHRTQLVADHAGVRWYNDSKGTNVGATVAAINGLPGPLVLIAGGDGKGQDFTPLSAALTEKSRAVILIGRDAPIIAATLSDSGLRLCFADDMSRAVALAADVARPGDSVLLSPACASFDMFKSYEERGTVFAAEVKERTEC
jgi:UDP-N-acetylmuramoylalanine--D-glutamate ligase